MEEGATVAPGFEVSFAPVSSLSVCQLTSFFLTCIPLISSFSCLVALVTTSSTGLSKYAESRHTSLLPIFSGNALCFSLFLVMLPVGLL